MTKIIVALYKGLLAIIVPPFLLCLIVLYPFGCFIGWDFNPGNWPKALRIVIASITLAAIIYTLYEDAKEEPKDSTTFEDTE